MSTNNYTIPGKNIFTKLWSKKYLFLKVWILTFIISAAYIVPQPRTYTASTLLAPEAGSTDDAGGLSSIASAFGFNIGGASSVDAIYPTLYPDLLSSNDFIVDLLGVHIQTLDGEISTDLYTYLHKHQKTSIYKKPFLWAKRKIKAMFADKNQWANGDRIDPSRLTEQQFYIIERLKSNILCTVDPLTNVISLKVNAQDPLVAANLTDSVCERLKTFITSYRTSKARVDVDYYEKLAQEAQINYKKALDEYSAFCDTHKNITQQATLSKRDDLEREVSMALSIYQTMITQVEKHKTKLQEDTPVFTTLQNASVPIKPSAPKRVLFCLGMLMLATIITSARILKDELYSTIVFFSAKSKGTDNKKD